MQALHIVGFVVVVVSLLVSPNKCFDLRLLFASNAIYTNCTSVCIRVQQCVMTWTVWW